MVRKYTQAQKIAYYKNKAKRQGTISGKGAYIKRKPRRMRKRRMIKGKGAYNFANANNQGYRNRLAQTGKDVGRALGSVFDNVAHFFGKGDYHVVNNSLLTSSPDMPPIKNDVVPPPGAVVIRKTEYIADVITSATPGAFQINTYTINPGLSQTFLYLSQIASNFEQYRLSGCYLEFKSTSADSVANLTGNLAMGSVFMAAQYNVLDEPFTSKGELLEYEAATSGKPSQCIRYYLECAPRQTSIDLLYVRNGDVPSDADARLYDICNFSIGTYGFQNQSTGGTGIANNIGELYIVYEIELYKQKLSNAIGLDIPWWYSFGNASSTSLQPLAGFDSNKDPNSTLQGITLTNSAINFPSAGVPQSYFVELRWFGATGAIVAFPGINTVNTLEFITATTPTAGDTARGIEISIRITTIPNTIAVINFNSLGTFATGQGSELYITKISNNSNFTDN